MVHEEEVVREAEDEVKQLIKTLRGGLQVHFKWRKMIPSAD